MIGGMGLAETIIVLVIGLAGLFGLYTVYNVIRGK